MCWIHQKSKPLSGIPHLSFCAFPQTPLWRKRSGFVRCYSTGKEALELMAYLSPWTLHPSDLTKLNSLCHCDLSPFLQNRPVATSQQTEGDTVLLGTRQPWKDADVFKTVSTGWSFWQERAQHDSPASVARLVVIEDGVAGWVYWHVFKWNGIFIDWSNVKCTAHSTFITTEFNTFISL